MRILLHIFLTLDEGILRRTDWDSDSELSQSTMKTWTRLQVYVNEDLPVTDKYSGEVAYRVPRAGPDIIEKAIAAAVKAQVTER